jgi:hypothetical protein
VLNVVNDITKGHNWLARGWTTRNERRRHNPPLANGFSQQRIRKEQTTTGLRRSYFGNHAVSVGNKHRFAAGGEANVFAEPVLEHFETDRSHFEIVATRSYICQRRLRCFGFTFPAAAEFSPRMVAGLGLPK